MNVFSQQRPIDEERRRFLEFIGVGLSGALLLASGKMPAGKKKQELGAGKVPVWLRPTSKDDFIVADGFSFRTLVSWGDKISRKGAKFGTNNDFLAFFSMRDDHGPAARLFVNHEAFDPLFVSGIKPGEAKNIGQVIEEQKCVGVSGITIREGQDGFWQLDVDADINYRIDATTPIPFSGQVEIEGKTQAIGTLGNCSGGVTPWGTALTGEENYHDFYGEMQGSGTPQRQRKLASAYGWEKFFPYPPEHYGWVVEIHPITGEAKKLVALGRFAHEGATCALAKDGRPVVYMGDDKAGECFYKFIGSKAGSLDAGVLYVADVNAGRWLPLDIEQQPRLKEHFKTQLNVQINARSAAKMVGGSALDRPEAAAIHPKTGHVYLTLTNNSATANHFGSIVKFEEHGGDHGAMGFRYSVFKAGGIESAFACPDNIQFDRMGNLWMTSDMPIYGDSGKIYAPFGNNGLFYIPFSGADAGRAHQVASAPFGAELTGPAFSEDGKTLFLSVQHPGEGTQDLRKPLSSWMKNDRGIPRSTVVAIRGGVLADMPIKS